VLGNPPLIAGASTTICTRFNSRAAPLCPNLDGNLCPTLTAHSEPLPFSELAETGSRQVIHISIRVLGWNSWRLRDSCILYTSWHTVALVNGVAIWIYIYIQIYSYVLYIIYHIYSNTIHQQHHSVYIYYVCLVAHSRIGEWCCYIHIYIYIYMYIYSHILYMMYFICSNTIHQQHHSVYIYHVYLVTHSRIGEWCCYIYIYIYIHIHSHISYIIHYIYSNTIHQQHHSLYIHHVYLVTHSRIGKWYCLPYTPDIFYHCYHLQYHLYFATHSRIFRVPNIVSMPLSL